MLKHIIICGLCLFLFSCQNKKNDDLPPIKKEALIEIIAEALIIEPALRELPKVNQDSVRTLAYEQVFSARGYTLAEFTHSMQWLQRDPLRLADVYKEVMVELDRKEALITSEVEEKIDTDE